MCNGTLPQKGGYDVRIYRIRFVPVSRWCSIIATWSLVKWLDEIKLKVLFNPHAWNHRTKWKEKPVRGYSGWLLCYDALNLSYLIATHIIAWVVGDVKFMELNSR